LRIQSDTAGLVGNRVRDGLDTEGQRRQADAQVPAARADLAAIDEQIANTRTQLAALVGAGPDRGLTIARPVLAQLTPLTLPANASVDLVGRRPDIVAARLRAEAARQRIKVAKADFYPNVDLTGNYGVQSLGLKYFAQPDSLFGALGPAIRLPIFTGGRLEGAYRGARAEYDLAVASYDHTLGDALRDVADAVTDARALQVQIRDAKAALASAEDADRIATLRYRGGLSPYLNVLTAENTVLAARRNLADLQAQALSTDIALVRALGGGFIDAPAARVATR
jgi:NodT family efflux transporter outer membrane factor (OMF) lipoprotein